MKVNRYTLAEIPGVCIPLGVAGENLATRVEIDCTPWLAELPAASITLLVEQPDGNAYPALVTMEGTTAVWTLQSADTGVPGYGKIEVRCNCPEGNQHYISVKGRTHLYPSIDRPHGGDPARPWVEDVLQAGAVAKGAAEEAVEAAELAKQAAANGGYIQFEIGDDGRLYMYRTENVTFVFEIEEGRLMMYDQA